MPSSLLYCALVLTRHSGVSGFHTCCGSTSKRCIRMSSSSGHQSASRLSGMPIELVVGFFQSTIGLANVNSLYRNIVEAYDARHTAATQVAEGANEAEGSPMKQPSTQGHDDTGAGEERSRLEESKEDVKPAAKRRRLK